MKLLLVITCIGLAPVLLLGEDCDCTHFPYTPESCEKSCSAALLQRAGKADLMNKIGLDENTASAIVTYRDTHPIKSVSELPLNQEQKDVVRNKLKRLNPRTGTELAKRYGLVNKRGAGRANPPRKH